MSDSDDRESPTTWLLLVLGVVTVALLVLVIYLIAPDEKDANARAAQAVLLNILSVLLVGIVIYIIFTRKGIELPTSRTVARELTQMTSVTNDSELRARGVQDFYPSFRSVPWDDLISQSRRIDMAVYYFDSWVKANYESVVAFFARGGMIYLFTPDPNDSAAVKHVQTLFPEYSEAVIKEKIGNTHGRFAEALEDSRSQSARVNHYVLQRPPQYSAIRFDQDFVLLSVYEAYRVSKIDSSALLINLKAQEGLSKYWDKEFGGMLREGDASE